MSFESVSSRLNRAKADVARYNPVYRAISHLAPDDEQLIALLDLERVTDRPRSDIHGLLVTVKGSIPVAGLPWTEGSALFADRIAGQDATIVAQARLAGGVVIGTTTLSELAMYGVENPFEPMGLNPWNLRRTAGGSSTGAGVACALDFADINIGTDSGGSIRNPACHCGVVGFMPRIGALSTQRTPGHSPSLSSIGLITRSVTVLRRAFAVLSGDISTATPSRRLIVPLQLIETMSDEATRTLFSAARQRLMVAGFTLLNREIEGWLEAERAAGVMSLYESGLSLAGMNLARASHGIRDRAALAKALTKDDLDEAWRTARQFKVALRDALADADADAVLTPSWPFAAPLIEASGVPVNGRIVPLNPHRNCFVRAANAIDACALTLPAGFYREENVPFGIHLMAPGGRDIRLLSAATAVEAALPPPPRLPLLDQSTDAAAFANRQRNGLSPIVDLSHV
jgi:Asp-tRNA(Asn)/Glu-tRNA(Gln) amidotransferase A subunit family amidase